MNKTVLVVGGAGYIGSHTTIALEEGGYNVVVLDDLSNGHEEFVGSRPFVKGDIRKLSDLRLAFDKYRIDAVVHFAAKAYVGESVTDPMMYYQTNVVGTINLLSTMIDYGVEQLVFSSSCATYGTPIRLPISEDQPQMPVNPYGRTKLAAEHAILDFARAYRLRSVLLRYFNVIGADPELRVGERHVPETHLVPRAIGASLDNTEFRLFGNDYETHDGTCVRDYVHVADLARAHVAALDRLQDGSIAASAFNIGIGKGFSVREVVDAVQKSVGRPINVAIAARRPGDPAALISEPENAVSRLGWAPKICDLNEMIDSAVAWEKKERARRTMTRDQ